MARFLTGALTGMGIALAALLGGLRHLAKRYG